MGMWIELFVFGLVFLFAWHQFRDLKKERMKRQARAESARTSTAPPAQVDDSGVPRTSDAAPPPQRPSRDVDA